MATKFKSYYEKLKEDKPKSVSGSRFMPTYRLDIDDDGVENLVECGQIDVYADIQSHALSCDLHYILDKFQATGDLSLFQKAQGAYGDFTDAPKTYAEMYQRFKDAEALFYQLRPEVRAEFHQNPVEFYASIGTPKFVDVVQKFSVSSVKNDVSEVTENVEKSE